jgi:hypothetical protein
MKSFLIVAFVMLSTMGFSQNDPGEIVKKFFAEFEEQGASTALDNLYSTNEWMSRATDAITNLKSQLEGLNEDYVGKYYGYELIVERKLAESYLLLSYLVKYDRQPIRFTFQFYKPDKEWLIYSFQFDGDLDTEIEESAKLYYLNLD